eukprot:Gb_04572 [translate_table: standard]
MRVSNPFLKSFKFKSLSVHTIRSRYQRRISSSVAVDAIMNAARSNSSMKHLFTSSFVGLQPQRSRLEVKSLNFVYVKCNTAASSNLISFGVFM